MNKKYKESIKKGASWGAKNIVKGAWWGTKKIGKGAWWGTKKIGKGAVKNSPAIVNGIYKNVAETTSSLKNSALGNKEIERLEKKLHDNSISYQEKRKKYSSEYPMLDYCVVSGLSIPAMIKNGEIDPAVELAYQYQYPIMANAMSFSEAWQKFDSPAEMLGFVSGIKGKLFEIKYLNEYISKTLDPGYSAKLAGIPNQEGFDIEIYNPSGQIDQQLQLKASHSVSYVKEHLEKYPEIDVVTLEDFEGEMLLANYSERLIKSDISETDLLSSITSSTDQGVDYLNYLPLLGFGVIIFKEYTKKEASEYQKMVKSVEKSTDYALNAAIISTTGGIGIPIVFIKHFVLKSGKNKRERIKYLKELLNKQKKAGERIDKRFNRRDFLKSLAIAPLGFKK